MNGFRRIQFAAARNGTWEIGGKDLADKILNVQELVSNEYDLLIEVTYSGYTVKSARLWDFSTAASISAGTPIAVQELTAADQDKADWIENVLLGNSRRF
ncbi:hypothetical protein [Mycobacteroides abscessus]|uniref:hypothetical protein n=1 Tax=Mycobacteroides abscessus TaxID=36809 RepID=UPI000C25E15F|nr:hypothetical protein [Mycobacteroides abscessus]